MSDMAPIPLFPVTRLRSAVTRKPTPSMGSYVVTRLRHLYTHVRVCVCRRVRVCVQVRTCVCVSWCNRVTT